MLPTGVLPPVLQALNTLDLKALAAGDGPGSGSGLTPPGGGVAPPIGQNGNPPYSASSPGESIETLDIVSDVIDWLKWFAKVAESLSDKSLQDRIRQLEALGPEKANEEVDRVAAETAKLGADKLDKRGDNTYSQAVFELNKLAKELGLPPSERLGMLMNLSYEVFTDPAKARWRLDTAMDHLRSGNAAYAEYNTYYNKYGKAKDANARRAYLNAAESAFRSAGDAYRAALSTMTESVSINQGHIRQAYWRGVSLKTFDTVSKFVLPYAAGLADGLGRTAKQSDLAEYFPSSVAAGARNAGTALLVFGAALDVFAVSNDTGCKNKWAGAVIGVGAKTAMSAFVGNLIGNQAERMMKSSANENIRYSRGMGGGLVGAAASIVVDQFAGKSLTQTACGL
ncbi:hypothetical protein [Calidithermus terrae]|nr:hypothetical protein [Calidithermus terrae]